MRMMMITKLCLKKASSLGMKNQRRTMTVIMKLFLKKVCIQTRRLNLRQRFHKRINIKSISNTRNQRSLIRRRSFIHQKVIVWQTMIPSQILTIQKTVTLIQNRVMTVNPKMNTNQKKWLHMTMKTKMTVHLQVHMILSRK